MKLISQLLFFAFLAISINACKTSKDATSSKKTTMENSVTEKYWKLIELNGNPVVVNKDLGKEPHLILKKEDSRIQGTGGCNTFTGGYELNETLSRISFKQVVSTMMACMDMTIETELLRALNSVDNYTLSADGNTLSLNKARMAPLARFEAVYMK